MHQLAVNQESIYRLAPDLAIEDFDNEAIVLLAMQDRLIKLNKPAAVLLRLILQSFVDGQFSAEDLAGLLEANYHMSEAEARTWAHRVLIDWSKQGFLLANDHERTAGGN